jgi:hypothetical protein
MVQMIKPQVLIGDNLTKIVDNQKKVPYEIYISYCLNAIIDMYKLAGDRSKANLQKPENKPSCLLFSMLFR